MRLALANGQSVRLLTPPNPWVGAVVVTPGGDIYQGATSEPGGAHAEIAALRGAGAAARGATLYTTLEPCAHHGRTGPCAEAVASAGIARVVAGIEDPDPHVAGRGVAHLRRSGIDVSIGCLRDEIERSLEPYLVHRRTGRPLVILKLASTLDGFIAAADGTSAWITGPEARADVHRLRAESDAIVVGAGTVRADDPALTVRNFSPAGAVPARGLDPRRVVLGRVPAGAAVAPALEWVGSEAELVDYLGAEGALQVLVEGGGDVAGRFHRAGLVDRYVIYLAPAIMGGSGVPALRGPGAATIGELARGRFASVERFGDDVRVVLTNLDRPGRQDPVRRP